MSMITRRDKIMAHLNRYIHIRPDSEFCAPFEITQDGIAASVGITRNHVSILLGEMVKKGEVTIGFATIRGISAKKRKVYLLTMLGRNTLKDKIDSLVAGGYPLGELGVDLTRMTMDEVRRSVGDYLD
jgi:hypothetical protein